MKFKIIKILQLFLNYISSKLFYIKKKLITEKDKLECKNLNFYGIKTFTKSCSMTEYICYV